MKKLYLWEDVFCSYTCGAAFAIADSKEEAIELISEHRTKWIFGVNSENKIYKQETIDELLKEDCKEHNLDENFVFTISGGD